MRRQNRYAWESETEVTPDAYVPNSGRILCVDFDGTLMEYAGWEGAHVCGGDPIPGAMVWLRQVVQSDQWDVHVHSSRSHQLGGVNAMMTWLKASFLSEMQISKDEVMLLVHLIYFPRVKPPAIVTLDERTIPFRGTYPTLQELSDFEPWTPDQ